MKKQPIARPHTLSLHQHIAATPAQVWRVFVDPALIPRWMGGFHIETTWQPGGPWVISGMLLSKPYREVGELLDVELERRLQFSHWSRLWRVANRPENHAVMTLTLSEESGGTLVTMVHALPAVPAIVEHSRFFWQGALVRLGTLTETNDQR